VKKEQIKLTDRGGFAAVEYVVPEVAGRNVDQFNLNLYGARQGVWIDVHVSKTGFTETDRPTLEMLAAGAKFDPPNKGK